MNKDIQKKNTITEEIRVLKQDKQKLLDELDLISKKVSDAHKEIDPLKEELSNVTLGIKEKNSELSVITKEITKEKKSLNEYKKSIEDKKKILQKEYDEFIEKLSVDKKLNQKKLDTIIKKIKKKDSDILSLDKTIEDKNNEIKILMSRLSGLIIDVDNFKKDNSEIVEQLDKTKEEYEKLFNHTLSSLISLLKIKSLSDYYDQRILNARDELNHYLITLFDAEILKQRQEFFKAIELVREYDKEILRKRK